MVVDCHDKSVFVTVTVPEKSTARMEADSCAACASGDAALERMATTQKRLIEALRLEHEARKRQENDRENEALSWRALYAEMVKSNQAVTAALWEEKRKAEERDRERERAAVSDFSVSLLFLSEHFLASAIHPCFYRNCRRRLLL